jgi:adenylate cyclase, class 2
MSVIETEVKFAVNDGPSLERRLVDLGFRQITPRTFERNILFDTPDRRLRSHQEILRVRRYGAEWVLTHKCLPGNLDPAARHKQRVETETTVADGEAIATIFENLGFRASFIYEKWRTEYADGTGHCVIDETPIGLYAELEGPGEWIDSVGKRLGVAAEEFMTLSYGRLFEEWQQRTGSSAENLTFDAIQANSAVK